MLAVSLQSENNTRMMTQPKVVVKQDKGRSGCRVEGRVEGSEEIDCCWWWWILVGALFCVKRSEVRRQQEERRSNRNYTKFFLFFPNSAGRSSLGSMHAFRVPFCTGACSTTTPLHMMRRSRESAKGYQFNIPLQLVLTTACELLR